ncbi:hypothetical protein ACET3Z_013983 [Daucus carota]
MDESQATGIHSYVTLTSEELSDDEAQQQIEPCASPCQTSLHHNVSVSDLQFQGTKDFVSRPRSDSQVAAGQGALIVDRTPKCCCVSFFDIGEAHGSTCCETN